MALNAREVKTGGGKAYPPFDAGSYPARLVQIIDCGVQPQEFKGEQKTPKRELMTTYEFLDEFLPGEDGDPDETKPRWLSERFPLNNLDSELAKSTKRYYALDPNEEEDGDWLALIGRPVMVTVIIEKGKDGIERNKIASVSTMRPKEAQKAPPLVNPPKVLDLDQPDTEVFLSLPDWVQKKIKDGLEYEGSPLEAALAAVKQGGGQKKTTAAGGAAKAPREAKVKEEEIDDSIPFEEDKPEADEDESW